MGGFKAENGVVDDDYFTSRVADIEEGACRQEKEEPAKFGMLGILVHTLLLYAMHWLSGVWTMLVSFPPTELALEPMRTTPKYDTVSSGWRHPWKCSSSGYGTKESTWTLKVVQRGGGWQIFFKPLSPVLFL